MSKVVFWAVTPCVVLGGYQRSNPEDRGSISFRNVGIHEPAGQHNPKDHLGHPNRCESLKTHKEEDADDYQRNGDVAWEERSAYMHRNSCPPTAEQNMIMVPSKDGGNMNYNFGKL